MTHGASTTVGKSKILQRVAALALGVVTFLALSSLVEPQPSAASDHHVPPVSNITPRKAEEISRALLQRQHPSRWPGLGLLEGTDYLVLMYGSPKGVRFTVCSRLGEILEEDLPAADVYRSFPDLDIPGMQLDPTEAGGSLPLMIVDPGH